jgi:DNA polymerase elongation subunit (family B)
MVIGCYYLTLMVTKNKQVVQKWFANEEEAIKAFYQKKINIHTPILVRYKISNFSFDITNKKLKIYDLTKNVLFKDKEILISKIFKVNSSAKKIYLITNIGVFIGRETFSSTKNYQLSDLLMETSPGRLIFSMNFKKAIQ